CQRGGDPGKLAPLSFTGRRPNGHSASAPTALFSASASFPGSPPLWHRVRPPICACCVSRRGFPSLGHTHCTDRRRLRERGTLPELVGRPAYRRWSVRKYFRRI